jgi:hypothetical protein
MGRILRRADLHFHVLNMRDWDSLPKIGKHAMSNANQGYVWDVPMFLGWRSSAILLYACRKSPPLHILWHSLCPKGKRHDFDIG